MSYGKRFQNMNPYDLHKTLINEYLLTTKSKISLLRRNTSKDKRDIDVIRENHQFLWTDESESGLSWEKKLAKKYYNKLYKEYCIGDLSRYKENKIGLRWRTEQELIDGKGQFTCGSKKCTVRDDLRSWEVNFGYVEHGMKKNALVKLRLCPECSRKLNYHHKKKEVKRLKHTQLKSKQKMTPDDTLKIGKNDIQNTEGEDTEVNNSEKAETNTSSSGGNVWEETNEREEDQKTREEEFDEYLNQLFL